MSWRKEGSQKHTPQRELSQIQGSLQEVLSDFLEWLKIFDGSRGGFAKKLLKLGLQRPSLALGGPGRDAGGIHSICFAVFLFFRKSKIYF